MREEMTREKINALLEITGISYPPIGVYDLPDPSAFAPFSKPDHCIFSDFTAWMDGSKSTMISKENAASYGCPGTGYWLCGIESMPREAVAGYLAGQEGLKSSPDTMCHWLEAHPPYPMKNKAIVISRLRDDYYEFLKTVTFFISPDQLGLLLTGAEYENASSDQKMVSAPYGSGCGQLLALFNNLDRPRAMIGATDIAMRKYLPWDILAFTVTKPMFEQLCNLDDNSFLNKTFWKELKDARAAD